MNRFASTRSEKRDSQPLPGRAQWRVGSIDDDGIRYGLTTHALIASTIAIAPTMVTIQSIVIRQPRGRPRVARVTGFQVFSSSAGGGGPSTSQGGGAAAAGVHPDRETS